MKTMKFDDIRQGFENLVDSVSEGWDRLRRTAAGALTRFRPGEKTELPRRDEVDDPFFAFGTHLAAVLGGDVFEDETRIVVRLEAPGLEKGDFEIDVEGDRLVVRGEKRFERESTAGRWRVLQNAYGSFRRVVELPAPVQPDAAQARYRNGVLRIELPKVKAEPPRTRTIKVE
jgi:HSP20 family protein